MVSVVSGKLGSGKSYHCVSMMIEHLLNGGVVATNMSIDLQRISKNFNRHLLPWQLVKVSATSDPRKIPIGDLRGTGSRRVLVVLDEALNWFASQGGAKDERKLTWGEWLRQSDKLGQDVFFVAQNFERAAKWIRELAQLAYNVVNLGHMSVLKIPLGKIFRLHRLYCVSVYDVNSETSVKWNLCSISPRVWECYRTAELYGFEAGDSAYIGVVPPKFRLPFVPFLLPLVLFLIGVFYCAL